MVELGNSWKVLLCRSRQLRGQAGLEVGCSTNGKKYLRWWYEFGWVGQDAKVGCSLALMIDGHRVGWSQSMEEMKASHVNISDLSHGND